MSTPISIIGCNKTHKIPQIPFISQNNKKQEQHYQKTDINKNIVLELKIFILLTSLII